MASLFLDHNLSPHLADPLQQAGHAVATAREFQLDEATDQEILQLMARAGLTVVTADRDFVGLHANFQGEHAGVLLVPQPRRSDARSIVDAVLRFLDSGQPLANALWAWSEGSGWWRLS